MTVMRVLLVLVVATALGLLAAGVVRLLVPGPRAVEVASAPMARVLPDARPLAWLDEATLLVARDGRIVRYDAARREEVGVVAPAYARGEREVFTPAGGVFATSPPWPGRDGRVRYDGVVYHRVEDWARPDLVTALRAEDRFRTNPHDGAGLEYREGPELLSASGRPLRRSSMTGPLVRTVDGRTWAYDRGNETLVVWARPGDAGDGAGAGAGEVRLALPHRSGASREGIGASYDWVGGRYLWYELVRSFDADRDVWPVRAWWVSRDGGIEGELTLPAGPWVRRYGFWYQLRHFSAGPATYSHYRVEAAGGRLFLHVWGRAVDRRVAGVYELDPGAGVWRQRVPGDAESVVVSTDGCRLAWAREGGLEIMELCSTFTTPATKGA